MMFKKYHMGKKLRFRTIYTDDSICMKISTKTYKNTWIYIWLSERKYETVCWGYLCGEGAELLLFDIFPLSF